MIIDGSDNGDGTKKSNTRIRVKIVNIPAVLMKCPVGGKEALIGDPRLAQALQQPSTLATINCEICGQNHDLFVSPITTADPVPKSKGKIIIAKN